MFSTFFAMYTMSYFNYLSNILNPYIEQVKRTASAVRNSFYLKDIYCFYEGNYTPVMLAYTRELEKYSDTIRWYFIPEENLFVECLNDYSMDEHKSISWLCAEIQCKGETVADITDFIQKLRYISANGLPPRPEVLIGLWSYENGCVLRRKDTRMNIISEEAENFSFDFIPNPLQEWERSLCMVDSVDAVAAAVAAVAEAVVEEPVVEEPVSSGIQQF